MIALFANKKKYFLNLSSVDNARYLGPPEEVQGDVPPPVLGLSVSVAHQPALDIREISMNSLLVLAQHLGEGEVAGVPGHLHHRQPRLVGPALHHLRERFVGGRPLPVLHSSGLQVGE